MKETQKIGALGSYACESLEISSRQNCIKSSSHEVTLSYNTKIKVLQSKQW